LITLRRRTRLPGAAAIQAFTGAPGAAELLVDVVGDTGLPGARTGFIRRDQPCDGGFDEGRFGGVEENVGLRRRCALRGLSRQQGQRGRDTDSSYRLEQPAAPGVMEQRFVLRGHWCAPVGDRFDSTLAQHWPR
jgi:hypothetical protein